jgi:hypothetical protein
MSVRLSGGGATEGVELDERRMPGGWEERKAGKRSDDWEVEGSTRKKTCSVTHVLINILLFFKLIYLCTQ